MLELNRKYNIYIYTQYVGIVFLTLLKKTYKEDYICTSKYVTDLLYQRKLDNKLEISTKYQYGRANSVYSFSDGTERSRDITWEIERKRECSWKTADHFSCTSSVCTTHPLVSSLLPLLTFSHLLHDLMSFYSIILKLIINQ